MSAELKRAGLGQRLAAARKMKGLNQLERRGGSVTPKTARKALP